MTDPDIASTDLDAKSIQNKIANREFEAALIAIKNVLDQNPEHAEALYLAAVCYRYQNNYEQAQQHLTMLKVSSPDKGRVFQEQGHLYRAQGKAHPALSAYQAACQFNPALLASWRAQHAICVALNREQQSSQLALQIERLKRLPNILISVMDLIGQGKLFKAEAICKGHLKKNPTDADGMRLLAEIALQLGAMDEAEFLLESAIDFSPDNQQVQVDYIEILRRRQKFKDSEVAAKALAEKFIDNPQYLSVYAIAKLQLGEYESAVSLFDRVLTLAPNDPATLTSRGHALKTWGKNKEAIESYRLALGSNPLYCEAYYSLSNLKTYRFDDSEIDSMCAAVASDLLSPMNRTNLYFALGKAYEDQEKWGESFAYYVKGNEIKKIQSSYDAKRMSEDLLAQREFFTHSSLEQLEGQGYTDSAPIFIVGLPRAGSTLLEQILSSHSQVDGTLELPNILTIAQQLRRKSKLDTDQQYPENLLRLSADEFMRLGKKYIDETMIHRQGAPFFIDKMPNNFRHIGLIKSILPNAKIIDSRRHPVACCFSGFKQLFAEGQEFSYSLEDISQYYNDYVGLMDHWDQVLPGEVLRVYYEDVTADLEGQVRRILEYCNLPFEEDCLEFYRTERAVRTASSEQVRQPINQKGVDQWRNFESHLQPLVEKLAPSLASYPHR